MVNFSKIGHGRRFFLLLTVPHNLGYIANFIFTRSTHFGVNALYKNIYSPVSTRRPPRINDEIAGHAFNKRKLTEAADYPASERYLGGVPGVGPEANSLGDQ